MCFHNHPSGDPEPSQADRLLTRRLEDSGRLLEIPLIDHIIIGPWRFLQLPGIWAYRTNPAG